MSDRKLSITKFYQFLFILSALIIVLSTGIALIIRQNIQQKVAETFNSRIKSQIEMMDSNYQSMEKAMANLLLENEHIQILKNNPDIYAYNAAVLNLKNDLKDIRDYYFSSYNFFYFDVENNDFIMPTPITTNYTDALSVNTAIMDYVKDNLEEMIPSNNKWLLMNTDEGMFFTTKIYHTGSVCVGCWNTADYIFNRFGVNQYSNVGEYMFLVKNNQVITDSAEYKRLMGTSALPVSASDRISSRHNYEITWYEFNKSDFSLVFVFDALGKYENTALLIIVLFVVIFSILFCALFLLVFIQRKLALPLKHFIDNLDLESVRDPGPIHFEEFDQINRLFANARQQIHDLKIKAYEQQLERYQLEMDYLQVQIKPHFYINCMTIIYSMAQSGHLKEIQQLSLETSDYLRSTFRYGNIPVTLKEELLHVQKYLNINSIRYGDDFSYQIFLPEELENYRILPLFLHTLIENSIKHGLDYTKSLEIQIKIYLEDTLENAPSYLCLSVSDSGPGYTAELLKKLKNGADCRTPSGRHIGLYNLKRRITYFYHEEARLLFSNLSTGGALTEIKIPTKYTLPEGACEKG